MSFHYQDHELFCEQVAVAKIAAETGTPFYLYSAGQLRENFGAYTQAFAEAEATICFAVKSCSNIAILKLLGNAGAGADTVSLGEIRRALLSGIAPEKIIFSGVGKTKEEIASALEAGVGQLNIESIEELEMIEAIAASQNVRAKISVRVNPDVDAGTHDKISTGRKTDKFGIPWHEVREAYAKARALPHLAVEGIACHIGSQITDLSRFGKRSAKLPSSRASCWPTVFLCAGSISAAVSGFATRMKRRCRSVNTPRRSWRRFARSGCGFFSSPAAPFRPRPACWFRRSS